MRCFIVSVALCAAAMVSQARAAETSFDSHGVRIAYLDEGQGEALVLLHGFSLSAREMWSQPPWATEPIVPELAKHYRVIAPDLRGHGASDKPHDAAQYGGDMAEDVVRLLDHLGVDKAHVVGYSMGATIAGKLLADHPDRLLSATFGGGGPLVRPSAACREVFDATAEALERGEGFAPLLVALTPAGQPRPSAFQASLTSRVMLGGKDQAALAAVMRSQPRLEVAEQDLAQRSVPALFVYGSREAPWKVELIATAAAALPHAEIVVLDGRDHMSTVASRDFWVAVEDFVAAHGESF
jgi:pimeloyl-ACP methyl ester carboxylesterase